MRPRVPCESCSCHPTKNGRPITYAHCRDCDPARDRRDWLDRHVSADAAGACASFVLAAVVAFIAAAVVSGNLKLWN